ncbi:MAG: L,D-transpeptidase [Alphaproteobacteria bacterium]|nr:L,D-transpeptidase [Alphaproteobacteria bacterium]
MALSASHALAMQVDILVDKVSQHMHVSVDGVQKYDWLVSTGGQGFDTPSGTFHIFRMEAEHFSQEWDNAPMPHSMFFTGIGHAIHGSFHVKALGTRASHGCVRLSPENAAILWDLITKAGFKNNSVVIKGGFFDNSEKLTTEATFHMKPKDHALALSQTQQPHGLFWWDKKPAAQQAAAKKVADNSKPAVKGKKKKKGLFLFGGQEG